jgi:hypothetical protein
VSDFERTPVFVSHTGTKHFAETYHWGPGAACTDRFLMGQVVDGLQGDVDCQRCHLQHQPITFDVVTPDGRTRLGYRVVHPQVEDREQADLMAATLSDKAYVVETPHGE